MSKVVLTEGRIQAAVGDIASHLVRYNSLHLWVIMDGAFMFAADLMRGLPSYIIADVRFLYVKRGYPDPEPPELVGPKPYFLSRHTHVFLDVVTETGKTMEFLLGLVPKEQKAKVVTCSLIDKGKYLSKISGVRVKNKGFIGGYGMLPYRYLNYVIEVPSGS